MTRPDTDTHSATGQARYDDLFRNAHQDEARRLYALADAFDPASRSHLTRLGVTGKRCLDVGAGPGTLSVWLSTQTGVSGRVHAVDVDTSMLTAHPDLTVLAADVTTDDFAPGTFDLVHARFLLTHLPERVAVLRRMATWVAPGGRLVVSDFADLATASSPNAAYRATLAALFQTMTVTVGSDINYGRTYPAPLAELGFTDIGMAVDTPVLSPESPLAVFWHATIERTRHRMTAVTGIDPATIDTALEHLTTGIWDLSLSMVTAWGRRPAHNPSHPTHTESAG